MGVGPLQEVVAHGEWTVSIKTLMKDTCLATTNKLATLMEEKSVGWVFHRASFSFKSFLAYNTYDEVMPLSLCQILENKALDGSLRKMNYKKAFQFWLLSSYTTWKPASHNLEQATSTYSSHGVLSSDRFWREIRILRSTNQSAKPRDLVLLFDILFFECPHWSSGTFYLHRKKCSTMYLKINR